ncbi:MAG: ribonuclease III, partial [Candidatus Margulisbacteria bacterium]|nr:ribonuclease III [Candidatus Margulisiibacteriota bacterium]
MSMEREQQLARLEEKTGVIFLNKALLNQALTHSSFANEFQVPDNERLEFLGDAVLKLVVSEYLYNKYPSRPEGDLTKIRAAIISDETLARFSDGLNMGSFFLLSANEKKSGGAKRKSNLANALEAWIGAVYLDAGLGRIRDFLLELFREEIEKVGRHGYISDWKSALQEYVQKKKWELPYYKVVRESGPRHKRIFYIDVFVNAKKMGAGKGLNKKEAEQHAAHQAMKRLKSEQDKSSRGRRITGAIRRVRKTFL